MPRAYLIKGEKGVWVFKSGDDFEIFSGFPGETSTPLRVKGALYPTCAPPAGFRPPANPPGVKSSGKVEGTYLPEALNPP